MTLKEFILYLKVDVIQKNLFIFLENFQTTQQFEKQKF